MKVSSCLLLGVCASFEATLLRLLRTSSFELKMNIRQPCFFISSCILYFRHSKILLSHIHSNEGTTNMQVSKSNKGTVQVSKSSKG